jgi:hypothetical protein
MVKDFLQRERERAAEEARDEKTRAEADQRAKTRAAELEQKIADYIKEKGISGVQIGVDSFNHVVLNRSTESLEITPREVAPGQWQYNVDQKRKGGSFIENLHGNLSNDRLNEDQMIDVVSDWF